MNYNDHAPPHFHAEYQDDEAINLVWAWLDDHQAELQENWERAQNRQALLRIEPLP